MADQVTTSTPIGEESQERRLRALLCAYADAWNAHDVDAIMAAHADDTEYEWHGAGDRQVGVAATRAKFASQLRDIPDMSIALVREQYGPDLIVYESVITGTHDGVALRFETVDVVTLRDGKITRKESYGVRTRQP